MKSVQIAVLFGGPSLERGISLNSARSVLDHLSGAGVEIVPIYFDSKKNAYLVSTGQLYSNTPSDFDFKLQETAKPLSKTALIKTLKSVDVAFPVMHGPFGEDGGIQRLLERHKIPHVGSPAAACAKAFDKYNASQRLQDNGFFTLPSDVLKIYHKDHKRIINRFFKQPGISKAVVKPAAGGSSIGVAVVDTPEEALEHAERLFSKRVDTRVVIEQYAVGTEFTVIILQNQFGLPVALLPTEIRTGYEGKEIFDFRKKYLPTNQVSYHCPPSFDIATIERIQSQAESIFTLFGMRDFARFDGWLMPDGNLWFSDLNPVSGMEQNSFLFQQSSRVGLSHQDVLRYIVHQAARHTRVPLPSASTSAATKRKPISVLFGGKTSERQVSLMSGTNVWLKLRRSQTYDPQPYLLDKDGSVWKLPYALTLNHTVEEIIASCQADAAEHERVRNQEQRARIRLGVSEDEAEPFFTPTKMSFEQFMNGSDYVFLALHGGDGEDGTLQAKLKKRGILYNGSHSKASRLCMDKYATGVAIEKANLKSVSTTLGISLDTTKLFASSSAELTAQWQTAVDKLGFSNLIVKPRADGCSSGIVRLSDAGEFIRYIDILKLQGQPIPAGSFAHQAGVIEMPTTPPEAILLEAFIETDTIRISGNTIKHTERTGWIETTVGVLERNGTYKSLNPSITVVEGQVLSLEEKFQGGTGVNITPPPASIIEPAVLQRVKRRIAAVAKHLGVANYCRIDAFVHTKTGEVKIIECNSLPGLTPSTVLYHQGLAEQRSLSPRTLLETIVRNSGY